VSKEIVGCAFGCQAGFIAVKHFGIVGGGVVVRSFFLLWDSEGFKSSFGRLCVCVCVWVLLFRGRRSRGREKGRSKRRRKRERETEKNHHTQGGKREGRRQQRGQR
jgi:hypothetical protein